jgi:hypothetical protein
MPQTNFQRNQLRELELTTKPNATRAMERIYAWYEGEIIDRPPVRFTRHNYQFEQSGIFDPTRWETMKDFWFDVEYQIERFISSIENKNFLGETFPVYWPNLGPNIFAGFYGCELEYGEVTTWAKPFLESLDDPVVLNWESEYLKTIDRMTRMAIERCEKRYLVGYTDLHPGIDWLSAIRDGQKMFLDFYDNPGRVKELLEQVSGEFLTLYDYFDRQLKAHNQLSVTWIEIPSFGLMHLPSCDYAAMISPEQFEAFAYPYLARETQQMDHNIFHLDGKGVARQTDMILQLPNVQAIQWVQGMGDDLPIMQWVPYIKRLRSAGKSVVVDLNKEELPAFMREMDPEGLLLCIATKTEEEERSILKELGKWPRQ